MKSQLAVISIGFCVFFSRVIAITVYCLLVVAFYAFFAPFVGGRIWEYVLIGVYSPVAILVFVLYVRCTAINPADPRIMSTFTNQSRVAYVSKSTTNVIKWSKAKSELTW
ncbi:hypothetical protein ISN44_As09g021880 [Arabidopsis suecica]|uniref:Uncharacterized protein n=1 Tax=Arabidopsis suecica TaxID=45249 RepID=A0A8T2AI34_ARASU|nr:hypothetical protein ISN44_As09g021880 [Arabidopsis suecica]